MFQTKLSSNGHAGIERRQRTTLAAMNVIVVSASGNNYFATGQPGVAYPSADPNVLSVGAVWTGAGGGPFTWHSGAADFTTGTAT